MRGGQWQALQLAQGLRARGIEAVLLARRQSALLRRGPAEGIPSHALNVFRLASLARRVDLVHAHCGHGHALAALACGSCPLIVSRRVAFPVGRSPASTWTYSRAARFVAVSQFVARRLSEAGIAAGKIRVVPDGVRPLAQSTLDGPIVAPATGDPRKGTALVLEAARIAGAGLHLSEELEKDLGRASLFVYATEEEGLGSAVLLAMSAGVPVVASRVGGLPEIITDGVTGLLVENEAGAFAAAIRRLSEDPAMAREFSNAGRDLVRSRFSVERMVTGTMEVYREVLG